jgi:pimeloyl-ACP methyl ester carboxylesterase
MAVSACGNSNSTAAAGDAGSDVAPGTVPAACPVVVSDSDCDKSLRPIVFVHGTYGSGDNFAHVAARLGSNGYCQDRIVAVEYNSLGDSPGNDCAATNPVQGCGKIDAIVDQVLAANPGFTQVELAGHPQGTAHCGVYMGFYGDKVAHYLNLSSPGAVLNVGNMPTLSLSSLHDLGGQPNHAIGTSVCSEAVDGGPLVPVDSGAPATPDDASADGGTTAPACNVIQVTFTDEDHFAVAASRTSFIQIYKYLLGKEPQYTEVQCGDDPITVQGISETFADNQPVTGMLDIHELSATPRVPGTAVTVPPADSTATSGPSC